MNRHFLATQLLHGLGMAARRQPFLWMAPFGPATISQVWQDSAMPTNAIENGFAPIERLAGRSSGLSNLETLLHLFLTTYLPEDILTKTDRASMFNSLEVRAPFLSRAVSEYAIGLPSGLKIRGNSGKLVLKRVAERYLPPNIVARKKHGFSVPIGHYIRTLFWDRCCDVLLSRENPVANWFSRPAIEAMLSGHLSGRHDFGKQLWSLYVLFAVADRSRRRSSALSGSSEGRLFA